MACGADEPIATIRRANLDKTLKVVEQAGSQGVQMLCMQEILTGPCFCADRSELVTAELDFDRNREVRNIWQFYRDRRPDSYAGLVAP